MGPDADLQVADERSALEHRLDRLRHTLINKTSGLSDSQMTVNLAPSDLTLGGIVYHLALVEDIWFEHRFVGNPDVLPWSNVDWELDCDWDFHRASELTCHQIREQFNTSVARSRAALKRADSLDQIAVCRSADGHKMNLRWIVLHVTEEYARHCGHADLIRESIDGVTGD